MKKVILITGATGFIGKHLVNSFLSSGNTVLVVSRDPERAKKILPGVSHFIRWDELYTLKREKINTFINFAGMNLGEKRWNEKVKKQIYSSRIGATRTLVEFISTMDHKPEVLVSASGVDYYGDTGDQNIYEDHTAGSSFAAKLTYDWEKEAVTAEQYGVRVVLIRTGLVIGAGSATLNKMTLPFKLFVGGPPGGGRQCISWIHIDDLVRVYILAADKENLTGALNAASPNPVTMKEFCKQLGKVLNRPSFFPVPGFILHLFFGEISDVILSGRKALPRKLNDLGFEFRYVKAYEALRDAFK